MLRQRIRKCYYKTLGTSVINNPMSTPSLQAYRNIPESKLPYFSDSSGWFFKLSIAFVILVIKSDNISCPYALNKIQNNKLVECRGREGKSCVYSSLDLLFFSCCKIVYFSPGSFFPQGGEKWKNVLVLFISFMFPLPLPTMPTYLTTFEMAIAAPCLTDEIGSSRFW